MPKHQIEIPKSADFLIDGNYIFEIGGKNKGQKQKQIQHIPRSYIVKDDLTIGNDNIIPLWLVGFLY